MPEGAGLRARTRGQIGKRKMTNLETELAELREKIKSVVHDQDDHRRTLMPVWQREEQLKKAIRATHGQKPTGVWYDGEQLMGLIFDRSRAGERKPLYDELQEIAERHGRVKEA